MTNKRRLHALEQSLTTSSNGFLGELDTLASLLGTIDGTIFPDRLGSMAVRERQRQYQNGGIVFSGSGGSSRAWKQTQRWREKMVSLGAISIVKSRSSLPLIKISTAAEQAIRAAAGLPGFEISGWVLDAINSHSEDRRGGWVSERTLFGESDDKHTLTETLLPLLVNGFVEAHPSTIGELFYRSTGVELPGFESAGVEYSVEANEAYTNAFVSTFNDRKSWVAEDPNEVFIPMSATR